MTDSCIISKIWNPANVLRDDRLWPLLKSKCLNQNNEKTEHIKVK